MKIWKETAHGRIEGEKNEMGDVTDQLVCMHQGT
jgi:hypothetical protein